MTTNAQRRRSEPNGFIDDYEFVFLYDLYALKNPDFPYNSYAPFDLEEHGESENWQSFAFENEMYKF